MMSLLWLKFFEMNPESQPIVSFGEGWQKTCGLAIAGNKKAPS
jgi:hypothetical protein